jgi:gamma-glutamylcyclotransferase (GGCT)/AIG2-like uncharacterized protein YtfP
MGKPRKNFLALRRHNARKRKANKSLKQVEKDRRYGMCGRKRQFRTYEEAKEVANFFGHRVYDCPYCGYYHMTHLEKGAEMEEKASDPERRRFFFYGIFKNGEGLPATVPGNLYDLRGIAGAALDPKGPDDLIHGEVHEVDLAEIPHYDAVEGYRADDEKHSFYLRRRTVATLEDGSEVEVEMYLYNGDTSKLQRIEGGDWQRGWRKGARA